MIKIKYNDLPNMVECTFSRVSDNVVQLEGGLNDTSGFHTYRMDGETWLGDFSDCTTIYRELENAVQYSNDGSVYVEPEPEPEPEPQPVDPTPSIEERISDLESAVCELYEAMV